MILWDTQVLVHGFRSDSPFHATARARLAKALESEEPWYFLYDQARSFLKTVTNAQIFRIPSKLELAWEYIAVLEASVARRTAVQDDMTWGIFKHLSLVQAVTKTALPDLWLAATALRHDACLVTFDYAYRSVEGLSLELLSQEEVTK